MILTMDLEACAKFWLFEYFPELFRIDRNIFPPISRYAEAHKMPQRQLEETSLKSKFAHFCR